LEDFSDLLVDCEGDSLDSTSTGESSNCGLCDSLDQRSSVLLQVSLLGNLSGSFSDTFSTFSSTCHCYLLCCLIIYTASIPKRPKSGILLGDFPKKGFSDQLLGLHPSPPLPNLKGPSCKLFPWLISLFPDLNFSFIFIPCPFPLINPFHLY